jgi:hypothetical protein
MQLDMQPNTSALRKRIVMFIRNLREAKTEGQVILVCLAVCLPLGVAIGACLWMICRGLMYGWQYAGDSISAGILLGILIGSNLTAFVPKKQIKHLTVNKNS